MLLRDGRTAHLRPIRPEDAELLVDFYGAGLRRVEVLPVLQRRCRRCPTRTSQRFTKVDHVDRVAFVLSSAGQMIAVGRYDVVRADGEAEVAFLVEDRHQGRGIAQLLLEHLAQAGRERGVERFVAEVLPDNQKMIRTFRDAGYRLCSGYEDGVMALEFPIDPTDTSVGRDASPASTAPRPPRSSASSTRARSR